MKLKPNTWYWYDDRDRKGYVECETVLHEGMEVPSWNYCPLLRTDENGEIIRFREHNRE